MTYLKIGQRELIAAWVLGERLKSRKFQNQMMWELLERFRRGCEVLPMHVRETYAGTYNGCAIRRLVVDLYLDMEDTERNSMEWRRFRNNCDGEFLTDIGGRGRRQDGESAMKASKEYMVVKVEGWTGGA